ncbi:hypothetical protein KDA_54220 [Dictyobacter alpinus]|uniref:Glycosyl transferase family 1 n=1 Tax=Dictyobacter alpinus TaxID=2014873 RepID=A0A402BEX5_9CHLR|nr:FtsX-like permease family protein [Dictyobacter alpinus]GCE29938.1 hypothetical protein KDA_54220 [Dictyobacter alpinus]
MRASIYLNYTTRSLVRGGQRTILALFCIAVGVMSIVALQLVGQMIANSYTSNIREVSGGDITASSYTGGVNQKDLAFFDTLKSQGKISNYTATMSGSGSFGNAAASLNNFQITIVDPTRYPLVGSLSFNNAPTDATLSGLLTSHQVVMDQQLADQSGKKVGESFDITVGGSSTEKAHLKLVGIVANRGPLQARHSLMLMSQQDYQDLFKPKRLVYSTIYVTVPDQTHMNAANSAIQDTFPLLNTTTTNDVLKQQQSMVDLIKKFLSIAGLLALLIGGIGIINTMQVLLSRRRIEIAMLKTTGYRRFDLYMLFGLESGLLGLLGGVIGALAACVTSYLVLQIMQNVMGTTIPFQLDPMIIGGGVLIGLCTALIFGLMPIVQAANIRPLNVIREIQSGNRVGNIALSIGLIFLLSVLFCIMAALILNSTLWAISSVYGTFVFLVILSLFFSVVVLVIERLPVPERFSIKYGLLVGIPLLIAIGLTFLLPAFGGILAFIALMGILVVLFPRSWKASVKMALRNIGRTRGRTTTTLLALFVGVFTIGLIITLGQNLRDQFDKQLAATVNFNVAAIAQNNEIQTLNTHSSSIPGLQHLEQRTYASVNPISVNEQPLTQLFKNSRQQTSSNTGFSGGAVAAVYLGSLEGYDLAHNQVPDEKSISLSAGGRFLQASDAGTDNVMVSSFLTSVPALKDQLKVGSTITLTSADGSKTRTVHIVGFYTSFGGSVGEIFSPRETVAALSLPKTSISTFYLKVDPNQIGKAINRVNVLAPHAGVENLADIGGYFDQYINNTILMLIALASLSLLAAVIIIANAVALAMLERRRELGILKSVGYTSRSILGEVLVENGVVGGTGALLAMLLVTLVTSLLGKYLFQSNFGVNWYVAIGLIIGVAALAILTALLVAWNAVRVRPLEVLRYE